MAASIEHTNHAKEKLKPQRASLDVCIDNLAGLAVCESAKVDTIELCSALELGGLTPCYGLMHAASQISTPVYAMIRPHSGDFLYSQGDIEVMKADIYQVSKVGLAGVVLGCRTSDMQLNLDQISQLCSAANGLSKTLHRVIDMLDDPLLAIDQAVELGFDRILTSGGKVTAGQAIEQLKLMQEHAAGRIEIIAGSGVNAANVGGLLDDANIKAVHSSCSSSFTKQMAVSEVAISMGFASTASRLTDAEKIAQLQVALM